MSRSRGTKHTIVDLQKDQKEHNITFAAGFSIRRVRAADAADRRCFRAWSFSQSAGAGVGLCTLVSAGFC